MRDRTGQARRSVRTAQAGREPHPPLVPPHRSRRLPSGDGTEGILARAGRTGISRRNKLGEASVLRGLQGKLLVCEGACSRDSSPTRSVGEVPAKPGMGAPLALLVLGSPPPSASLTPPPPSVGEGADCGLGGAGALHSVLVAPPPPALPPPPPPSVGRRPTASFVGRAVSAKVAVARGAWGA